MNLHVLHKSSDFEFARCVQKVTKTQDFPLDLPSGATWGQF